MGASQVPGRGRRHSSKVPRNLTNCASHKGRRRVDPMAHIPISAGPRSRLPDTPPYRRQQKPRES